MHLVFSHHPPQCECKVFQSLAILYIEKQQRNGVSKTCFIFSVRYLLLRYDSAGFLFFKTFSRITQLEIITINVPFVFMARYVMVLRGATSFRGALEGVGPENQDFFGP